MTTLIQPLRPYALWTDKNGVLTREAYDFLNNMFIRIGGSLSSLNAITLEDHTWDAPANIGVSIPAQGQFTSFGCNGKTPQPAVPVSGSIAATGATSTTPFGYTTAAQANAIVTLLNQIRAALVANGITV